MSCTTPTTFVTLAVERTPCGRQYRVSSMSKADYGRLQIQLAESEMPGLMACRAEFGSSKPLRGTRITGCLHMTTQTAVLIETLTALGASVRWCSSDPFSTDDFAAAAVARDSASVFAWRGQSLKEYCWCLEQALDWGQEAGPHLLIDDGGDATLFVHEGVRAEEENEQGKKFSATRNIINERQRVMIDFIRERVSVDPRRFRKMKESLVGVSEHTSSGVMRLRRLQNNGSLLFPAINVNNTHLTSRIENTHGMMLSTIDGLRRALDNFTIGGKVAVVCGFGDVGKGCCAGLAMAGARVIVTEIDPIYAMEALMCGHSVRTLEDVVSQGDLFITTTGNMDVITVEHMKQMKDNVVVCNLGKFEDEIDFQGLMNYPNIKRVPIKPLQSDMFVFPETNKSVIVLAEGKEMNLASRSSPSNMAKSCSYTNQVMAQLDLWNNRTSSKYEAEVYMLPRQMEEKVARLHIGKLGAKLTTLTCEQANYINVPIEGPYKTSDYNSISTMGE